MSDCPSPTLTAQPKSGQLEKLRQSIEIWYATSEYLRPPVA